MRRITPITLASAVALAALVLCGLAACVRQPRPDDAGDYAFGRQVIPKLYGRRAKGFDEVKLVGDLSAQFGRETTLRTLMAQPDFEAHWSEVLVDRMRINRTGAKSQASCFPETLTAAANSAALAAWIRDHEANTGTATCGGGSCGAFTMSDVLRSSMKLDDLSPVFRAYLFPLINQPPTGAEIQEPNKRSDLFKNFETVYLGRSNTCLACHNSAWSMSGAQSYWNRTHPIWGLPELAVYGANTGRRPRELESMMRTDAASGAHQPWGMATGCGSFNPAVGDDNPSYLDTSEVAFLAGSHNRRGTVFDIDRQLRDGINDFAFDGMRRFTSPQTTAACAIYGTCTGTAEPPLNATQLMQEGAAGAILGAPSAQPGACSGCHASDAGTLTITSADWKSDLVRTPAAAATMPRVKPGDAANSYLMRKIRTCSGCAINEAEDGSERMPYGGPYLNGTQIAAVETWINGLPADAGCGSGSSSQGMCDGTSRELDAEEALAMLVGTNTVNAIWTEVMGYPLPIDNWFARNGDQRNVLWNLTEFNFMRNHWSPREVLLSVLRFRFYNRKPPSGNTGSTGYEMAMVSDPWVEGDPRIPPQAIDGWTPGGAAPTPDPAYDAAAHPERHHNAMTEIVHRYPARTLLNSVSRTMAWPKPKRFPDSSYPSATLVGAIGQFIKDAEPGFRGTDMQGLLTWESIVGQCAKPAGTANDWIDQLLAARAAFDAAHPADPITVRDFAQTMRDWLINDAELRGDAATGTSDAETQLIANLFGVGALNTSASTVTDLPGKARRYCGVLLKSPQFMLAGIATEGLGNKPRLQACNVGDDCSYQAMCNTLRPALQSRLGGIVICSANSVNHIPRVRLPELMELFPKKWLWGIEQACAAGCQTVIDRIHLDNPRELAARVAPQFPNPAGTSALPVDFLHDIRNGRLLTIGWAGEKIETAEGVGTLKSERLAESTVLADGDVLVFAPGGEVEVAGSTVRAPDTVFAHLAETKLRADARVRSAPLIVHVVDRTRLQPEPADKYTLKPRMPLIQQLQQSEWLRHGSAGRWLAEPDPRARLDTPERQQYWKDAKLAAEREAKARASRKN